MYRHILRLSISFTAATGLLVIPLYGAKPPAEQPATVTFRCTATVPDTVCPAEAAVSDAIRGDGPVYSAKLDSAGELFLVLTHGGGRTLWLDFRNGPAASCPTCRRDFDTLFFDDVIVHTNVSDASGIPVGNGLKSIPVGGSSLSRLNIAFNRLNYLGQTVQWSVRFNPVDYPGSDLITVRHPSATVWEIEADPALRAVLFSYISHVRNSDVGESPFYMPFKLTVVSPVP